jgi:hypothetical protein
MRQSYSCCLKVKGGQGNLCNVSESVIRKFLTAFRNCNTEKFLSCDNPLIANL